MISSHQKIAARVAFRFICSGTSTLPSPPENFIDPGYDPEHQDVRPSLYSRYFNEYKESMQPPNEPGYFTQGEFGSWDQRVDIKPFFIDQYEGHGDLAGNPNPEDHPSTVTKKDRAIGELHSLKI